MEPKISSAEKKRKVTNPRKGRPQVHILKEDLGYMALLSSFNLIFHRIHGIGTFTYINHEHQLDVGKYTIYHTWILWDMVMAL